MLRGWLEPAAIQSSQFDSEEDTERSKPAITPPAARRGGARLHSPFRPLLSCSSALILRLPRERTL